jgi:hypothetical protein
VVWPRRGRAVVLSSNHFVGLGRFEDRSASFRPFVDALVGRIAAANRNTRFVFGMPPALWWFWVALLFAVALLAPLSLIMIVAALAQGRGIAAQAFVPLGHRLRRLPRTVRLHPPAAPQPSAPLRAAHARLERTVAGNGLKRPRAPRADCEVPHCLVHAAPGRLG